jgi:hypothetical protein
MNTLYHGDDLKILRNHIKDESSGAISGSAFVMFTRCFLFFAFLITAFSGLALGCECGERKIPKVKGFHGQLIIQAGLTSFEPVQNLKMDLVRKVHGRFELVQEVISDESGHFEIPNLAAGKYFVRVDSKPFAVLFLEIRIRNGMPKKQELEIQLELAGTCCTGSARVRKRKSS